MVTLQPAVGGLQNDNNFKKSFANVVADAGLTKNADQNLASAPSSNHDKPISGSHKGFPSVYFPDSAISDYASPLRWILIGKFAKGFNKENPKLGRPAIEIIEKFFVALDLKNSVQIGLLDNRHIMISLKNEEDYLRIYSKMSWYVEGHLMRIFKWTTSFHVEKESSLVPVWIKFPKLPLHFFNKEAMFTLASLVGSPLRMDTTTANLTRPSYARIQVEVDLMREMPQKVWIGYGTNEGFWQKLEVEHLPFYCNHCWHVGHKEDDCTVKFPELLNKIREKDMPVKGPERKMVYRPKRVIEPDPNVNLQNSSIGQELEIIKPQAEQNAEQKAADKGKSVVCDLEMDGKELCSPGLEQGDASGSGHQGFLKPTLEDSELNASTFVEAQEISSSTAITLESGGQQQIEKTLSSGELVNDIQLEVVLTNDIQQPPSNIADARLSEVQFQQSVQETSNLFIPEIDLSSSKFSILSLIPEDSGEYFENSEKQMVNKGNLSPRKVTVSSVGATTTLVSSKSQTRKSTRLAE